MSEDQPYPGLRPFDSHEAHIFFGREEQTDELLPRLSKAHFLAVVGLSGCGKSSLVRAGLLAALETGYMAQAGPRWRLAVMRPGGRPMRRLARALIEQAGLPAEDINPEDALGFLIATLRRGPLGLVEALAETPLQSEANLLIVVDQFEEIFRFCREGDRDEADAFVSLLLASARQRRFPVYVVITMRSDFVGDCAVFSGLPEAINESQFLTPRLTRDQREAAITGPARVFGGDVEPALVARLLNEMGADPDQLPVLQHLLMRMWTIHSGAAGGEAGAAGAAGSDATGRVLTVRDYEAVGGMKDALSRHADEALACLDAGQRRIAELVFRRLSERGSDQRDVRRPTRAGEIAALADVTLADLVTVIDVFRAPGSNFLTPPWPEPIRAETVLDISHESLIRQWSRLRDWAEQEAQSAETYRFLEQTARRWRKGEAALWGTPDLENALVWRQRQRPTAVWAQRYGGDFPLAMVFLDCSEQKRRDEEASTARQRRRQVRRLRGMVVALAALCLFLVGSVLFLFDLYAYEWEYVAYYNTFVKRWGEPSGYGELTGDQVRQRPWSLKVVTRGRWGPVEGMEAVDGHGRCHNDVDWPITLGPSGNSFEQNKNMLHDCRWEFVRDSRGQVIDEKAYNARRDLVWELAYAPSTDPYRRRQAYFVGPDGSLQLLKNTRLHSVEIAYSPAGDEISLKYWSYSGESKHPEPGQFHAYGEARKYDANGLCTGFSSLSSDHMTLMNNTYGNSGSRRSYDSLGNILEESLLDKDGRPVLSKKGWHRVQNKYDPHGNRISVRFFGVDGQPVVIKEGGYHQQRIEYTNGDLVATAYFDANDVPVNHTGLLVHRIAIKYENSKIAETRVYNNNGKAILSVGGQHETKFSYDSDGNLASLEYFDSEGKPTLNKLGIHLIALQYEERGNVIVESYFDENNKRTHTGVDVDMGMMHVSKAAYGTKLTYDDRGNRTSLSFLDETGHPVRGGNGFAAIRYVYDDRGNNTEEEYLDKAGNPARLGKKGYAKIRREYDDRGNVTMEEYRDEKGALVIASNGYAIAERGYDDGDRIVEEAYHGTHRNLISKLNGYAIAQKKYDPRDRVIEEAYYDEGHNLIRAIVRHRYDDHDNDVEVAYFGADGKLLLQPEGFAIVRKKYDDRGNVVEQAYYDGERNPTRRPDGNAILGIKYDDRDRIIQEAYYDENGGLVVLRDGFAIVRHKYDDHDNDVEVAYFGADGKLLLQPDGFATISYKYDDRGHEIEESYFDQNGRLLCRDASYAKYCKVQYEYNENGLRKTAKYTDVDGHALVTMTYSYDADKKLIGARSEGKNGEVLAYRELVRAVIPELQAEHLLLPGDIILRYAGTDIDSPETLLNLIKDTSGGRHELVIRRDGKLIELQAKPGRLGFADQPTFEVSSRAQATPSR